MAKRKLIIAILKAYLKLVCAYSKKKKAFLGSRRNCFSWACGGKRRLWLGGLFSAAPLLPTAKGKVKAWHKGVFFPPPPPPPLGKSPPGHAKSFFWFLPRFRVNCVIFHNYGPPTRLLLETAAGGGKGKTVRERERKWRRTFFPVLPLFFRENTGAHSTPCLPFPALSFFKHVQSGDFLGNA